MNKYYLIKYLALMLIFGMSACSTESTNSENIRTTGIWARMVADANTNGTTRLVVELNSGGSNGTNIILSAGDRLEATANGQTKVMQQDSDFLDIDYETSFDTNAGGTEIVVNFIRPNDNDAPTSRVSLPQSFSINAPETGQTFSSSDSVLLTWTNNSAEPIDFNYSITCELTAGGSTSVSNSPVISDDGDYLIALVNEAIFSDATVDKNKQCSMNIFLERESIGTLDANFTEGGSFKAYQTRSVQDIKINIL